MQKLQQEMYDHRQRLSALHHKLEQITGTAVRPTIKAPYFRADLPRSGMENFIGLNVIHLIGIVALVIGLSIGVKYAIDRNLISEWARISLAYGAGMVLLVLSFRLRKNYAAFSAILFSGGMASLYFTTYAAFVYYSMMPFAMAYVLMVAMTVFTAAMASSYNRQEIALLGLTGAYGIPFLISQNSERADLFFLYIFLINCGIAFLCFRKGWKNVGRVAQALTWILFLGWGFTHEVGTYTGTGILFMSLFFLLFLFVAFSGMILKKTEFTVNDVHQAGLNNLALFLASLLVFAPGSVTDDQASVTGLFAIFIALQTWIYYSVFPEEHYLKTVHFIAGLVLAVFFIYLKWEGITVTLLWLLMAVVIFAWGVGVKSMPLRISGVGLIGLTLAKLVLFDSDNFTPVQKVISYITLGVLLLLLSYFYQKFREKLFADE